MFQEQAPSCVPAFMNFGAGFSKFYTSFIISAIITIANIIILFYFNLFSLFILTLDIIVTS